MSFHKLIPASGLAVLLSTTGAFAQVTAQQVWDDWKGAMAVYGEGTVTIGSETYANGVLTVTDLGLAVEDDGFAFSGTLPQMLFSEQADGSVLVTMSDSYPFAVTAENETEGTTTMDVVLGQAGTTIVASGAPGAISYALTAPRYEIVLNNVVTSGEAVPVEAIIGVNNSSGTYTSAVADGMRSLDYVMSSESADIKVAAADPEGTGQLTLSGTLGNTSSEASMVMPADMSGLPEGAFPPGFSIDASQTTGAMDLNFSFSDEQDSMSGRMTMTGGSLTAAVSQAALNYSFDFQGLTTEVQVASLPFPVSFAADSLGMGFAMPMSPSADGSPSDFAARINLAGLTINEEIWAMLDPGAIIPRDPATVNVDVTGTATLTVDLTSPEAQAMTEAPGEVNSLNINDLTLAFGGANAHASGSFTLDNTDMTTFPGMPRPTGKLDIALNGVNGLIGKLAQIGIVPPDQVMGVQMMLGMFSVPVGDDQLTSTIEFTADGQLLANGQRLQ